MEQSEEKAREALLWRGCARMPNGYVRPHVTKANSDVYIGGGTCTSVEASRTILKYNAVKDEWTHLPISPYYTFGLVVVDGKITTVGGVSVLSSLATDRVCTFDEGRTNKWCQVLPPMTTERCVCSAVGLKDCVIVVGGMGTDDSSYLDSVELLDLHTKQWMVAASAPLPLTFMASAVCEVTDRLYLCGGLSPREGAVKTVISCKLADLKASTSTKTVTDVWESISPLPFFRAGCAAINGKLVVATGLERGTESSMKKAVCDNTVQAFDPKTRTWSKAGVMPAARSSGVLTALGDQIIVFGGYVDPKNWTNSLTRDVMATVNLKV